MSSPKSIIFPIFDPMTNAPVLGAVPTFVTYKDDTGANVGQPAITEVGGGFYKFTPVFTAGRHILYVVDTAANNPPLYSGDLRPEDYLYDLIQDLSDEMFGEWRVFTTGPDANKLVLYRPDSSVLKKFNLKDQTGAATFSAPFRRIPE
jgi:hypothetical protein